jgi:hypothetical protein
MHRSQRRPQLLETLSKIFNGNDVKGRQRFWLNLCNVSKTSTSPFQILIHPSEQKIVAKSVIGRVGGNTPTILFLAKMGAFC